MVGTFATFTKFNWLLKDKSVKTQNLPISFFYLMICPSSSQTDLDTNIDIQSTGAIISVNSKEKTTHISGQVRLVKSRK